LAAADNGSNRKALKNSAKIALSGVIVALCAAIMFLTGVFPIATYSLPAIAGFLMVVLVVETDFKTAMIAYTASSVLVYLISPDQEAKLMYIFFFGHYCILKSQIEKLNKRWLEYIIKLALFNVCIVSAYSIIAFLFGLDKLAESFGDFGKYSLIVFLFFGNVIFVIYDFALTNLIAVYIKIIRPKFLRRA
jgi:hypothetical protein